MDKQVQLKKPTKERKNNRVQKFCHLSTREYMQHLGSYYINNPSDICNYIISELIKKQNSYKKQDETKQKYNPQTFIALDDIVEKLLTSKMLCYYCRKEVCIFYDKIRQSNQWTLERIDNMIGHSCANTVISCLDCNLKRRTSNSDAFCFAKQLVIKKV